MTAIPGKNDYAASFFISKRLAHEGVKKTHVHALLGSIPQALLASTLTLLKTSPYRMEVQM